MYQNFYYSKKENTSYIWDDVEGLIKIPYKRYAYVIDGAGEFETINGLRVKKTGNWSKEAEQHGTVFENDVPIATRVLIDKYFDSDEPSGNHRIVFLDIEVEKAERHSTPQEAKNKITAITYSMFGQYMSLVLDEAGKLEDVQRQVSLPESDRVVSVYIRRFDSEKEMLKAFITQWNIVKPTIISGWNSENYDVPYLVNRIEKVMGYNYVEMLSPIGIIEEHKFKDDETTFELAGISHFDYMLLYKKFTYNEESSYSLESISMKELKRGKFKYEGTLDDLLRDDIEGFIQYIVTDVELLNAMDAKLNLIEIARGICHVGHVPYKEYLFSSKYLEGAALTYCKRKNKIAIRINRASANNNPAEGALVKSPIPGLYKYIIDLDLTSLYPSIIRTLNISPETLFGKVLNWNGDGWVSSSTSVEYEIQFFVPLHEQLMFGKKPNLKVDKANFKEFIDRNQLCIASNGTLFKNDKIGLLPDILATWFAERKRLSGLAAEYGKARDTDKYKYYDQRQLIQKILLNSFYGVLLLPSFRFYNRDIGEAVTLTGQSVITKSMDVANAFCNSKLNTKGADYICASDTDSMFLPVYKFINPENAALEESVLVSRTLEFANDIQTKINEYYDEYSKIYHNVNTHFFNIKQEMIAESGFFLDVKKRYALKIINKKGVPVNEIEIKGLDVVRSSFPKIFRKFMRGLIVDVLERKEVDVLNASIAAFRDDYKNNDITNILIPSSVKELSKFLPGQKGTPIHVKSAQNYNALLEVFDVRDVPRIQDGDKIMYGYVQNNQFGFETIALKGQGEDPALIVKFAEKYLDRDKIFENTLMSKIEKIWGCLGFGNVVFNTNGDNFF